MGVADIRLALHDSQCRFAGWTPIEDDLVPARHGLGRDGLCRAICDEIGERLRAILYREATALPPRLQVLMLRLVAQDLAGSLSIPPSLGEMARNERGEDITGPILAAWSPAMRFRNQLLRNKPANGRYCFADQQKCAGQPSTAFQSK